MLPTHGHRHVDPARRPPTSTSTSAPRSAPTVTVTYTYVSDTRPPDPPTIVVVPAGLHRRPQPRHHLHRRGGRHHRVPARHAHQRRHLGAPAPARGSATSAPATTASTRSACGPPTPPATSARRAARSLHPRPRSRPLQPVLTFEPPPLGQSAHPTWAFTIETGATARCSLDGAPRRPAARRSRPTSAPPPTAATPSPSSPSTRPATPARPSLDTYVLDRLAPCRPDHHQPTGAAPATTRPRPGRSQLARRRRRPRAARSTAARTRRAARPSPPTCPPPPTASTPSRCATPTRPATRAPRPSSTYDLDRARARRAHHHEPTVALERDHARLEHHAPRPATTTECRLDAGPWLAVHRLVHDDLRRRGATACTCSPSAPPTRPGTAGPRRPPPTRSTPPPRPRRSSPTAPADPSNSPTPIWTFTVDADSTADLLARRRPWVAVHLAPPGRPHQRRRTASTSWPSAPPTRRATSGPSAVEHASRSTGPRPTAPSITSAPSSPGIERHGLVVLHHPGRHHHPLPHRHRSGLQLRRLGDQRPSPPTACTASRSWPIDPAGNRSATTMAMYTLDRVAPVPPTITASPTTPDRRHDAPVDVRRRG